MKLYVTKNDEGKYWDYNTLKWSKNPNGHYTGNETSAKCTAFNHIGNVAELVEKPELVEVSEEEATALKNMKASPDPMQALWFSDLVHIGDTDMQNRLMRAYVNGWTVKKPKQYLALKKLPGKLHVSDEKIWSATHMGAFRGKDDTVSWGFCDSKGQTKYTGNVDKFTDAEIKHYGLQDCELVEVKD